MNNLMRFKEFIDFNNPVDNDTREILIKLSDAHPLLFNHPVMKTLRHDKSTRISLRKVTEVHLSILERSTALARKAGQAAANEQYLILAEMNLLNAANSALSSVISSRMQMSIERLSNVTRNMR